MNEIEEFLSGNMEMRVFLDKVENDIDFKTKLNSLVPNDAIGCRLHSLWSGLSYDLFDSCNYIIPSILHQLCRFDGSIGDNLSIFSIVRKLYVFSHPDFHATDKYDTAFLVYLESTQDCYDGPEVHSIVEQIVLSALTKKSRTAQVREAKALIRSIFHVEGSSRPHWIQGPEWPMGIESPMKYTGKKKKRESIEFLFQDARTGQQRVVIQYY